MMVAPPPTHYTDGGAIGCEWLHPKALEIFDADRPALEAAAVVVEAGDW